MATPTSGAFRTTRDAWWGFLFFILSGVAVAAFFDAGILHGRYELEAMGLSGLPPNEIQFLFWYSVWGSVAIVMLGAALVRTTYPARIVALLESPRLKPNHVVVALAAVVFVHALLVRHAVLLDLPITDDESTYDFIAKTLLRGRVMNPTPVDPQYYTSQFVVMGPHGWYGKYPIGHSLVLAAFALTRRLDVVGPLLASVSLVLAFQLGRRLFSDRRALLGVVLLSVSPHFVFTHATRVSQVTSGLALLAGLLGTIEALRTKGLRWLLLAGGALAFGILTRPMPGVTFAAVGVGTLVFSGRIRLLQETRRLSVAELLTVAGVTALGGFGVLVTNFLQTGSPWSSGYIEVHHSYGAFQDIDGGLTNSVGGAFVRENAWLFGWPFSLVLVCFGKPLRGRALYFGALGGEILYRVLVPKTVVSTTGPIYMTEIVPLLALGSADGAVRLGGWMSSLGVSDARVKIGAFVAASCVISAFTFVPVNARALLRGAIARSQVFGALHEAGGDRNALVFCNEIVDVESGVTWAYYPPAPSPTLDEEQLFVRFDPSDRGREAARVFWRQRYPRRRAFMVRITRSGPSIEQLSPSPR